MSIPNISIFRTTQKEDIICNFILRENYITGVKSSEHYHFHSFYEFHAAVTGKMHILVEDKDLFLESGNVCIIPPNMIHYIFEDRESFRTGFRFSFSPSNYTGDSHFLPHFQKSFGSLNDVFVYNDPSIYETFLKTAAFYIHNPNAAYIADELLFFAIDIVSHAILQEPSAEYKVYDSDNLRSECIEDYLNLNYHATLKIEDLSNLLGLSIRQTEREISRLFHMTFSELILKKRLTIAKFLLRKTAYTIEEIAFQTGFYDASHFCHKFTEHFGITPTAYRTK